MKLRVSPGAKRTAFRGTYGDDAAKLSVAAPPFEGKANAEVIRFLAQVLTVPRNQLELVSGSSGRDKTVLSRGMQKAEALERLESHLP